MVDKPVIFISYSHKDEPDPNLEPQSFRWLTYVKSHLEPAAAHGNLELWDDRRIEGGGDWRAEIDNALNRCAVCVFLVSRHSLSSRFILDVEMKRILERHHARGAHLYPIVITSCDLGAADWLMKLNLKPRDGTALEIYQEAQRNKVMAVLAKEIRVILSSALPPHDKPARTPDLVDIDRLPLTAYKKLVARDAELETLDKAWADDRTNIISLIAWGGAGKTALLNEWLARLRNENYRGAVAVLGWSFYDQGTKERTSSADEFFNWALEKLSIKVDTTSATTKGEKLAEALAHQRVLLVLDGVEPLQYGPGGQEGHLKDQGLRVFLRRFAVVPPASVHGLVVLTSRLEIRDIEHWRGRTDNPGPVLVIDLGQLSEEAGAALLKDNGVVGPDREIRAGAQDFEGHALALTLLASLLARRHQGDIRRRDRIGPLLQKTDARGHDHARRVMQAYESEWLKDEPVLSAILHLVGLFDRPASAECLAALRSAPPIEGVTESLVDLNSDEWADATFALREVRLLDPEDITVPGVLDAHPLVREWFGERLRKTNEAGWHAAHGRLYEHLRDMTKEGPKPTLEKLAPLYQAISHGCQAGLHQIALDEIFKARVCRRKANGELAYYSLLTLGAVNSDLAAVGWFFKRVYEIPISNLDINDQSFVLGIAAFRLSLQGRFSEANAAYRARLELETAAGQWVNATQCAANLCQDNLDLGNLSGALVYARTAESYADQSGDQFQISGRRAEHASVLHALGDLGNAERLFIEAERLEQKRRPEIGFLQSYPGYCYCDLLISKSDWPSARRRANRALALALQNRFLLDIAFHTVTQARAHLGLALERVSSAGMVAAARGDARDARVWMGKAVDRLRAANVNIKLCLGFLARAVFRRSIGDCAGAARDLDEVKEIAELGPMRLYLCNMALERARLAFARIEAFAPLNGLIDDSPPKPERPGDAERKSLQDEAAKQLAIVADYIEECGYHRRDEELAELQAVLAGKRTFASLPPRV